MLLSSNKSREKSRKIEEEPENNDFAHYLPHHAVGRPKKGYCERLRFPSSYNTSYTESLSNLLFPSNK